MSDAYFYDSRVARLQVLLEEVTRARPGSPESRFVSIDPSALDRLGSNFHHVLFGRRGSGKSTLLRHIEADRRDRQQLVAWGDQETFMSLSYPDVLVSTLQEVFRQFAKQLRERPDEVTFRWYQWRKRRQHASGELSAQLDEAVALLIDLKSAPNESQVEWTASSSLDLTTTRKARGSAGVARGPFRAGFDGGRESAEQEKRNAGVSHRYLANKSEHLERAVTVYRDLMRAVAAAVPDPLIILDDFYRLSEVDQPRIAGYFHRVVKDTGAWLKIGSIRYWTKLYSGSPAIGMQVPNDIRELSLDRGLLDFQTSKRFLGKILTSLAAEAGVDLSALFTDGALDRLVLASGGVPRDFIGLVSESIAVARNRGPSGKSGTERIIAEDVNEAAGRTVELKFRDLEEDAGDDASALKVLVVELTDHCRSTRSACFLVDFQDEERVRQLNRLQNMRFVHALDTNETLPDSKSNRYNVYLLDVSQLAAQRAWQVDFMGWTRREKRRARKLVLPSVAAPAQAADAQSTRAPRRPDPSPANEQLSLDDAGAVVGTIDPPVEAPQ